MKNIQISQHNGNYAKIILCAMFIFLALQAACYPVDSDATSAIIATASPHLVDATTSFSSPTTMATSPTLIIPNNTPIETRLPPDQWQDWPIVSTQLSTRIYETFQLGQRLNRDPHHFSKAGDCQNINPYFLYDFDFPESYRLGSEYEYLTQTVEHFGGSWSRQSLAVAGGMNIASALSPLWADPNNCSGNEFPIACEIRVHNPSIVLVSYEVWGNRPIKDYEKWLRDLVDYVLSQGVVPILATKADQYEGDYRINQTVAKVAYEYELPLWNFWASLQLLPDKGLSSDQFHITCVDNYFDDPVAMRYACPWRNLTALQMLDFLLNNFLDQ